MNTPETDKNCWREGVSEWVAANFARELERERDKALESLAFVAEWGGKTHETECGDIRCDGDWCAEQARSAVYLLKEKK
jgi:hypothetical protein